jgi:geranylgeranyl pyrophosphate synthase
VQFGEAMAILTGDALLTRAFGVLAESGHAQTPRLVSILARGAGTAGMIAGQVADMDLYDLPDGPDGLWYIHERKTAALIAAAVTMGATCAGASDVQSKAMEQYGRCLGLAFQLFDDLLDVTGSAAALGKTPGKDAQAGKRTGVAEMGLEELTRRGRLLTRQATEALAPLGGRAGDLRLLADLLTQRTH